ncbi:MAG: hypothetical protein ABI878_02570 [Acidobacteriota bacterium]
MPPFGENNNSAAQTAWACVVYSMVPYLGILFVPGALIASGLGLISARTAGRGGRRLSLMSLWITVFILAVQIFLWWLLYFIPTLHLQTM